MAKVINLKHCQQESIGFCLPACVQMALQYYGKSSTQREIAALFGTSKGIGTPFSRITLLQQRGFAVKLIEWSSIEPLIDAIRADRLVIASVLTTPGMPGWSDISTQHAILIVGIDDEKVSSQKVGARAGALRAREESLSVENHTISAHLMPVPSSIEKIHEKLVYHDPALRNGPERSFWMNSVLPGQKCLSRRLSCRN